MLEEENMVDSSLYEAIQNTFENRRRHIEAMEKSHLNNAVETIMKLINESVSS